MFNFDKKIILTFFVANILFANSAFAQYEITHAKTVGETTGSQSRTKYDFSNNSPDDDFIEDEYYNNTEKDLKIKTDAFLNKFKRKKKKTTNIESELPFDSEQNAIQENQSFSKEYEDVEIDENNKFKINADKITYSEEDGNVYAKGNVEIIATSSETILKADTAVLEKNSQTLRLQDNVRVLKNGTEMTGEYLLIDFNEENVLVENPLYKAYSFEISAQEGYLIANNIEMLNGVVKPRLTKNFHLKQKRFKDMKMLH